MLTESEMRILDLISRGLSYEEIAAIQGRSKSTIKNTMYSIRDKLNARSNVEADRTDVERSLAAPDSPARLLGIGEAAAVLSVHPNTLRRYERLGMIHPYRVGPRKDRRYLLADVTSFLERTKYRLEE